MKRNLTSEILQFSKKYSESPAQIVAKNILSTGELLKHSEQQDEEFERLRHKTFSSQHDKLHDELESFRRDRERIGYQHGEEERLVQRLLAEIVYKKENERRAENEIKEIQYQLRALEQTLLNAKDFDRKREFAQALDERKALVKIEEDLYKDVVMFKEMYDKFEIYRLSGKALTDYEQKQKQDRLIDVRNKKEQVDTERKRLQENISCIKLGDFDGINKQQSNILIASFKKRNQNDTYAPMTIYTVDKMQNQIRHDSDRIKNMRKNREDLLKKELILPDVDEFHQAGPISYADMAQNFLLEIEGRHLTMEDKIARLTQIRENITRYGLEAGMKKARVRLRFDNSGTRKSQEQMEALISEIQRLKGDYAGSGGQDFGYLNNLENLEKFYIHAKDQIANTGIPDELDAAIEQQSRYQDYSMAQDKSRTLNLQDSFMGSGSPNFRTGMRTTRGQFSQRDDGDNTQSQVEKMEQGAERINALLKAGNKTMTNMQLRMGGLNPRSIAKADSHASSEEELALIALSTQEKEAVIALGQIPANSEIYHYKLAQIKQMSLLKRELEKIVQEQRLARMWKDHQSTPAATEEQKMKRDIAQRLKNSVFNYKNNTNYDPNVGFLVDFEWVGGLPKKIEYVEIIYGVYSRGEVMAMPKMIEAHKTDMDTVNTSKCIFGEQNHIYDVPARMDALLIFEFQVHYSTGFSSGERVETYGWTQVDLFDMQKNLKRGKWKCPIYSKPTNTSIAVESIRDLSRIEDVWFYFRILKPDDEEFMVDRHRAVETTQFEHAIPAIHGSLEKKSRLPFRFGMRDGDDELPILNMADLNTSDEESFSSEEPTTPPEERVRRELEEKHKQEELERLRREEEERQKQMNQILSLSHNLAVSKGLRLTIYTLKFFTTRGTVRLSAALLDGAEIILDEHARPCAYNSRDIEAELDTVRGLRFGNTIDTTKPKSKKEPVEENKTLEVRFDESHIFFRNLPGLIVMKQGKLDINLAFQILIKPPRKTDNTALGKSQMGASHLGVSKLGDTSRLDESRMGDDRTVTEEEDFRIESWFAIKINNMNGTINFGRFQQKMYAPPILRPPFEESRVEKLTMELDYQIEEYVYDANEVAKQNIVIEKPKKPKEKKVKMGKIKMKKEDLVNIDMRPFIINTKPQYNDRPFEKGNGIDFYIHTARFLPDNVTVTKVVLNVIGQNMDKILPPQAGLPKLDTDIYNPVFDFRQELRAPFFDPTALALISIETIDDRAGNEVRIIGYCAINLFINAKTKEQPQKETDHDIILLNGLYQVPIFCQEPFRKRPFNMKRMTPLDRLPSASLLIQINQAPKTEDGLKVLGINDVPEKDWEKRGVWTPKPDYHEGKYNTSFCTIRDSEKELFLLRQTRDKKNIKERGLLLMTEMDGITNELTDREILGWIDDKVQKTQATEIIDLMYFAKYQRPSGMKFALDGFHNVTDSKTNYFGLYFLNSTTNPAALYQDRYDSSKINLNSNYDWTSPCVSPRFLDGFVTYKDIEFDKNLTIIIDVRSIQIKKNKPVIKTVGWTALPVFSADGYVQSGIYQLPIFKGAANKEIIAQLAETEPWDYLKELYTAKNAKLSFLEPMSAVVRLLDGQREGHFQTIYDYNRMNYRYLPEKKNHLYAYNAAVDTRMKYAKKLSEIIPNNGNPKDYNKQITTSLIEIFELKQYLNE